jgi:two-component system, LytTR family, sensor kinase
MNLLKNILLLNTRFERNVWLMTILFLTFHSLLGNGVEFILELDGEIHQGNGVFPITHLIVNIMTTPYFVKLATIFKLEKPHILRNMFFHIFGSIFYWVITVLIAVLLAYMLKVSFNLSMLGILDFYTDSLGGFWLFIFSFKFVDAIEFYFIVLGAVTAFQWYERYQESKLKIAETEKLLSQMSLKFLKAQMQPHFLFNTHHTIISLMNKGETEKATKTLMLLSDLLRQTLKIMEKDETSLENEVKLLHLYLDIQRVRFKDRLQINFNIPNDLTTAALPSFLLQPLVENAVQYAIEPNVDGGIISVSATRSNGSLMLCVSDNGTQFNEKLPLNFGVGLSNTAERLENLYGEKQRFDFNQSENGFAVNIEIPFRQFNN